MKRLPLGLRLRCFSLQSKVHYSNNNICCNNDAPGPSSSITQDYVTVMACKKDTTFLSTFYSSSAETYRLYAAQSQTKEVAAPDEPLQLLQSNHIP
jgi:hypothetical protein